MKSFRALQFLLEGEFLLTYILYAGGPLNHVPLLEDIKEEYPLAKFVGVDRGVLVLMENGIVPTHAIGDFDSITNEELEWIRKKSVELDVFPKQKDQTDMELALTWVLKRNPEEIILVGATGGRLDHLFINAQLLLKGLKTNIPVSILDRWNKMSLREKGTYKLTKGAYTYVSLIPFTPFVEGLSLTGFKYPLEKQTLMQGSSLCISNEITDVEGVINFTGGKLFLIQSRD